jgi:hypothetical protein
MAPWLSLAPLSRRDLSVLLVLILLGGRIAAPRPRAVRVPPARATAPAARAAGRCAQAPPRDSVLTKLPPAGFPILMFAGTHCWHMRDQRPHVGIKLYKVAPGSIFDEVGICDGDEVLAVANVPIDGEDGAMAARRKLAGFKGQGVPVEIRRGGQTYRIDVHLADSLSDGVVRVSRSCLKSFESLLVSGLDWYVPTSHRGISIYPHQNSVFWRLGVRPRDAISAIGGVSIDTPDKLLEAAATLRKNESAPYEIRISRANGTTRRIVVESTTSTCQSFAGANLL